MNSIKRPNRNETEEDLFRQQEKFLAEHQIKRSKNDDKQIHENSKNIHDDKKNDSDDGLADHLLADHFLADAHQVPPIVCQIVERNVDVSKISAQTKISSAGFPVAYKRDVGLVAKKGCSLFASQLNATKSESQKTKPKFSESSLITGSGLGTNNWRNEMNSIRCQNNELLKNLSDEQIVSLRDEVMNKLSPKVIEFLRKKKNTGIHNNNDVEMIPVETKSDSKIIPATESVAGFKPNTELTQSYSKNEETNNQLIVEPEEKMEIKSESAGIKENEPKLEPKLEPECDNNLPIKQSQVKENKWVHMNVVEKDKLSWIGEIRDDSNETKSARFNFEGNLVDPNTEVGVHMGLHHHGEDPNSAGYTIDELLTFLQSNFPAQKQIGLEVFAKIFEKAHTGFYDACFNINIVEQLLKNSSFLLVVRTALDENSETIWKAGIHCLHAIICNTRIDEAFLDKCFVAFSDSLSDLKPSVDPTIKLEEINDEQYLMLDVVECLVKRTEILQRIRFLIDFNKSQLDAKSVNNMLEIVIRLARHSDDCRSAIINCPHFIESIVSNFMPVKIDFNPDLVFNKTNSKALKLIRILITPKSCAKLINDQPTIIEALKIYLTLNPENCSEASEMLQVTIESLRIWLKLISQKIAINSFLEMLPIIIKQLQFCQTLSPVSHKNSFDWHYASTLLAISKHIVIATPQFSGFNDLIAFVLFKWMAEAVNEEEVPTFDINMTILCAVEFLLTSNFNTDALLENVCAKVISSDSFLRKLFSGLIEFSNIINFDAKNKGILRDSPNLPSFGSLYFCKLNHALILSNESPILLVLALIRILKSSSSREKLISHLLKIDYMQKYILNAIKNIKGYDYNIFDVFELNLMSEICLLSACCKPLDTHCYINLTLMILSLIKDDTLKASLIHKIVFNKLMYDENLSENMSKISIEDSIQNDSQIRQICIQNLNAIKESYIKTSSFNSPYWIFDPIIKAYRSKKYDPEDINNCLSFVYFLASNHENYFKQMIGSHAQSVTFCMTATVFLISNDLFFEQTTGILLESLLKKLLTFGDVFLQKETKIPLMSTVGQFFVDLTNQFESVSYGNKIFTNFMLIFCQKKCDAFFRKQLFTENVTALPVIKMHFNEMLIRMDNLLSPTEDDSEALEAYMKALLCNMLDPHKSPIMYLMAVHHLNNALFRAPHPNLISKNPIFDKLIRSVNNSSNSLLKHHLYNYLNFDKNELYGINLKK